VIFAAYYMLPMVQRILFNKLDNPENKVLPDLSGREIAILVPLIALMIGLGVNPTPVLERMRPGVQAIVEFVEGGGESGRLIEAARDLRPVPSVVMEAEGETR
jgi:NADH-quinone oxidoreductase subunit M